MLKINIVAIGKIKEKYIVDGISEFKKRLSTYVNFNIVELNENKDSNLSVVQDSKNILKFFEKNKSYKILLDISADYMSSEELADMVSNLSITNSEISFIIGGSRGVTDEVRKLVDKRISFSKLTFPHQLFRLMLTEQIYRAICINNNIKYHK
ncbi:23S rRNA (pseudouridine(1915)-N(3))-methyltransferase RlmH [Oceanivirga miroungae]|uniref:Ribosomal RNA large subunit methyltransferase H n=1 Tax=Oceanivirga miroungae TaxID=1130046 RepID=A0A6I8MBU4_9FUSO|nr:23S rRNA (pseudouridine(1915)-N(3))-methyltransferase RlmH [Oceanivirga miroungae]VWL85673.1 Ribosomal RNA large subunit methyltransferase H [Oceanivirga miroungae]